MHAFQCFAFFLTQQFSRYIFKNEIRVRFTLVRATYSGIPLVKKTCFENVFEKAHNASTGSIKNTNSFNRSLKQVFCDNLYNSAAQNLL
jgi:hypothetical protein